MLDNGIKTTLDDYHKQPGVQTLFFLPSLLDHLYPEKMEKKKKKPEKTIFYHLIFIEIIQGRKDRMSVF